MTVTGDIKSKVQDYLDGDYEVTDARAIPSVEDLPFGKTAKKMNLCVFYIDLMERINKNRTNIVTASGVYRAW